MLLLQLQHKKYLNKINKSKMNKIKKNINMNVSIKDMIQEFISVIYFGFYNIHAVNASNLSEQFQIWPSFDFIGITIVCMSSVMHSAAASG